MSNTANTLEKKTKSRGLSKKEIEECYKAITKTYYLNFDSFDDNFQGTQSYKEFLDKFDQEQQEQKK